MKTILCTLFVALAYNCSSQLPELMLPVGHTGMINQAVFSADGKLAATASDDRSARIWEVSTERLLYTLTGHTAEVDLVAFNSSSTRIITGSRDNTARVWDLQTGKLLYTFTHSARLSTVAFSPDDKYILTSSWKEAKAIVRNAADGRLLFECEQPTDSADMRGMMIIDLKTKSKKFAVSPDLLRFNKDSRSVIMVTHKGIRRWSLPGGELLHQWDIPEKVNRCHDLSPDGKYLVTRIGEERIKIWNLSDNSFKEIFIPKKEIRDAAISPDSKKLVVGTTDGSVQLWDCTTGRILHFLEGHRNEVTAVYYFSDECIISEARAEPVRWYDTGGKTVFTVAGENPAVSPDKQYMIVAGRQEGVIYKKGYPVAARLLQSRGFFPSSSFFSQNMDFGIVNYEGAQPVFLDLRKGINRVLKNTRANSPGKVMGLSSDGQSCFFMEDDKLSVIDRENNKEKFSLDSIDQFTLSADAKYFSFIKKGKAFCWDAVAFRQLAVLEENRYGLTGIFDYSAAGDWLIGKRDSLLIYNLKSGNITGRIKVMGNWRLAPDGKTLFATSLFSSAGYIYSFPDGKPRQLLQATGIISTAVISNDSKKIVTTSWDGRAVVWSYPDCKPLFMLKDSTQVFTGAVFSPDNKYICTAAENRLVSVWDAGTGKLVYALTGHTANVVNAFFSRDGKKLMTKAGDHSIGIWEAKPKGAGILFYNINNEIVWVNGQGYYSGHPDAVRRFYFRKGLKTVGIEQLDIKYNRPDLLLGEMNRIVKLQDTLLMASYRKAWEKRIKKLGIDTAAFRDGYSVPECDFVNRDIIEYEQKSGSLSLHIKGSDSTRQLDRFNVWVNEAPVFGQRGISIRMKNNNSLDTTITIKLSRGENRIETSITNINGAESYRMPVVVNHTPAVKQKETIRFIGIGIDKFADPKHNLQYSRKDIRNLSEKLKEKFKDDIIIDTLFNENVTIANVKALKAKLQQTTENDKVIISYSGHGLLSKEYDYYLSTYSINFDKPEQNGLPYEELENLLDSIPARKKLMLIDACHSGEVDKDEIALYRAVADSLKKQGTKGGELRYTGKTQVGMKNSFELMQSLFVNVGKSTGATIISAAAGTQFALERGDLENGVFTYCILEAMEKNPGMKISELKKTVGERVEQLTNGLQKPTSRNETIAVDWSLW